MIPLSTGRLWAALLATAIGLVVAGSPLISSAPADPTDRTAKRRYIVELVAPPAASYRGGAAGLAATAPRDSGHTRLETADDAVVAYVRHLQRTQDDAIASVHRIAPGARIDWRYYYTLNGFAAEMTPDEALVVMDLPEVRAVAAEDAFRPEMDSSIGVVNAPLAWAAAGGPDEAGLGARVAIVDSGLDSNHPFLSGDGMPEPPAGFPAATLHVRDPSSPDGYRTLDYPAGMYTNNKVIGARIFVSPNSAGNRTDEQLVAQLTPYGGGHGHHVAGTAAGTRDTYELTVQGQTFEVEMSGVAPKAWLLNYKANYAASPEYLAMLDQMVVDAVDVLNMSQGHVVWLIDRPESHPLARAFDAAADAGIVVVVSAGNSGGNGPTSLSGSFKYSEKMLAVGNTTSSGSFDVVVSITGVGAPLPSLAAAPPGRNSRRRANQRATVPGPRWGLRGGPGGGGQDSRGRALRPGSLRLRAAGRSTGGGRRSRDHLHLLRPLARGCIEYTPGSAFRRSRSQRRQRAG